MKNIDRVLPIACAVAILSTLDLKKSILALLVIILATLILYGACLLTDSALYIIQDIKKNIKKGREE